jgi:hypothetical protein
MADIELVIKIPEHYYENNIKKELPIYLAEDNIVAILPKGHGRLIEQPTDADIAETIGGQNDFADCIREAVATVFENMNTVIEADGGAE